ncbi:MAG: C40 family peptidase [Saprospiraceae bacterium]
MRFIRFISFIELIITMASCSSVRLAVYDYQKRHDYKLESQAKFVSSPVIDRHDERSAKTTLTEEACKYIGTPYKYGGCDAGNGFDCSGFVYTVAKSQDLTLPRSSTLMAKSGNHIPWKKAQQGDLVFFGGRRSVNKVGHVGIVDKNKGDHLWVIHSTCGEGVVKEDVLASPYWKKRILFAINVLPAQGKS